MIIKMYNYLKKRKEIINGFCSKANYMCPGEYCFDDSIEYLIRNDENTKKRAKEMLQNKFQSKAIYRLFLFLLRKLVFTKNMSIAPQNMVLAHFAGTVYTPVRSTNGYSDNRIFDFSHQKVLSIYTKKEDYHSVLSIYENFKVHFPMPEILWTNEQQLLIMEELILHQPSSMWVMDDYSYVINDVFERYLAYFKATQKKGITSYLSPKDLFDSLLKDERINCISRQLNVELFDLQIPCLPLHGDLWTSNTLLVKADAYEIKYIDWEYSKELFFFYDFFIMMWIEFYWNSNDIYLEKYAKGDYDHYFIKIFSLFNLTYNPSLRVDYFHVFFLNYYKDRLVHYSKKAKTFIFNQYNILIEKMANS